MCKIAGCAVRYLTHDAFNGLGQATVRADANHGTDYAQRFQAYLHEVQERDLTLGIAMTDAKGDRSLRPAAQANRDSTSTSRSAGGTASSSAAPRRSSPARLTSMNSW